MNLAKSIDLNEFDRIASTSEDMWEAARQERIACRFDDDWYDARVRVAHMWSVARRLLEEGYLEEARFELQSAAMISRLWGGESAELAALDIIRRGSNVEFAT